MTLLPLPLRRPFLPFLLRRPSAALSALRLLPAADGSAASASGYAAYAHGWLTVLCMCVQIRAGTVSLACSASDAPAVVAMSHARNVQQHVYLRRLDSIDRFLRTGCSVRGC
jgi:hypothetical protein